MDQSQRSVPTAVTAVVLLCGGSRGLGVGHGVPACAASRACCGVGRDKASFGWFRGNFSWWGV